MGTGRNFCSCDSESWSPLPIAGIGSFATASAVIISSCPSLSPKTYQFAVFVEPVVFLPYLFVLNIGLKEKKKSITGLCLELRGAIQLLLVVVFFNCCLCGSSCRKEQFSSLVPKEKLQVDLVAFQWYMDRLNLDANSVICYHFSALRTAIFSTEKVVHSIWS